MTDSNAKIFIYENLKDFHITNMAKIKKTSAPDETTLIRLGGWFLIIGAILGMISNVFHPRNPQIEIYQKQIETVARSQIWVVDHLVWGFAGVLMLFGFIALSRSFKTEPARTWGRFAYILAIVNTSLWVVLIGIDGLASKSTHSAWFAATGSEASIALHVAEALEHIDVALFSMYIMLFFGINLLLYGIATVHSLQYPKWMGYCVALLAIGSFIVGWIQASNGLSFLITNVLFASFASFEMLWTLAMGVLLLRRN